MRRAPVIVVVAAVLGACGDPNGPTPIFTQPYLGSGGQTPAMPGPSATVAACLPPVADISSNGACVPLGARGFSCNPLTNEGCVGIQACQYVEPEGRFRCTDAHAFGDACDPCDAAVSCGQGLTCAAGVGACKRYCCTDDDCGGGGCVIQREIGVGVCDAVSDHVLDLFGVGVRTATPRAAPPPVACHVGEALSRKGACLALGPAITCDPATNFGCASLEACDLSGSGFLCYPKDNTVELCGQCDSQFATGPFCAPGTHCTGGVCAKYCCDDSDCGEGRCDYGWLDFPGIGVCAVAYCPAVVDAGTAGAAGDDTSADDSGGDDAAGAGGSAGTGGAPPPCVPAPAGSGGAGGA